MTGYNRLNGTFCTEDARAAHDDPAGRVGLRGHRDDRLVRRRRHGRRRRRPASTSRCPGRAVMYGHALADAVRDGRGPGGAARRRWSRRWLTVIDRLGAWDDGEPTEESIDRPEHRALARRAASDSMRAAHQRRRPPARSRRHATRRADRPTGGARAHDGRRFRAARPALPDVAARRPRATGSATGSTFEPGCRIDRTTRQIAGRALATPDGERGVLVEFWPAIDLDGDPAARRSAPTPGCCSSASPRPGSAGEFSFRATTDPHARPERTPRPHARRARPGPAARRRRGGARRRRPALPRGARHLRHGEHRDRERPIELVAGASVELVVEHSSQDASSC